VSTLATFTSFVLSTAVLFAGPRFAQNPPAWFAVLIMVGYLAAIPFGGLIGAIAGFLLTRKLLRRQTALIEQ
jgi:hypothetical protein